jgi:hypothetical protein
MKSGVLKSAQQGGAPGVPITQDQLFGPKGPTRHTDTSRNGNVSGMARRRQPTLLVGPNVLSDSGILGLIEDWLAPVIADRVVRDLFGVPVNDEG